MAKIKLTEKKLRKIYEKSKKISHNFKQISDMLLVFPEGLKIVRYAVREGIRKFGQGCSIDYKNIRRIEKGERRLGPKRINRIFRYLERKKPNFSWKYILTSYHELSKLAKEGFFGVYNSQKFVKISKEKRRETVIRVLKSLPMNKTEKMVYDILKSNNILFEREAPLNASKPSIKMIIIDFAIPSSKDPKILIEVTNGRIEYLKISDFLTQTGIGKLILGYRIKKFLPKTKLFLVSGKGIDTIAQELLLEVYDFIFVNKNVHSLPLVIKETLNADQN